MRVNNLQTFIMTFAMEEINYNEFDKECINLCKTLNEMDGLNTTESCCGHLKDR